MEQFQGTKAPTGAHAFDTAALQAYLQQHLPGFAAQPVAQKVEPLLGPDPHRGQHRIARLADAYRRWLGIDK